MYVCMYLNFYQILVTAATGTLIRARSRVYTTLDRKIRTLAS